MEKLNVNNRIIADKLNIKQHHVDAVLNLFDSGATVPFIARYRKEATGSLDETAVLGIKTLNEQLQELNKRRESILKSLTERNILTSELKEKILSAADIIALEDIYLPFRPKRRTRAVIAREKGLEPLAKTILKQIHSIKPGNEAEKYLDKNKEVLNIDDALTGAKDIIAESVSENINSRDQIRKLFHDKGVIFSKVLKGKEDDGLKFRDYFEWEEKVCRIPGHRVLAIFRGKNEGILSVKIRPPEDNALYLLNKIFIKNNSESSSLVYDALLDSYKRLILPSIENEVIKDIKEHADDEAIGIFSANLRELLMQAPLGHKNVLALDPGFRTGAKLVCLNSSGDLLHNETIFPVGNSHEKAAAAERRLVALCLKFKIEAIAIGNGTAGRETEAFVRNLKLPDNIIIVMVNESGASIYSASETARKEFPDYDLTVRGAVSIGRRLMDPLAELVKIDPKSIGVGQYQHDVDQSKLKNALSTVVESCVNSVGVELNTASEELLTYVSGVGPVLAKNIINYRRENGLFKSRNDLKKVKRLGANAFEQCAGFLRINNAANPLDSSGVHPESYYIVKNMAKDCNCSIKELTKNNIAQGNIKLENYITEIVGVPTLKDIMNELAKPGRDPRDKFEAFAFNKDVNKIEDLIVDMELPGIVTNVTKFGAFVDVGVHQDGLVHISELAHKYINDPADVVKVQQKVKVKVIDVDLKRKRVALSIKACSKK